MNNVDLIFVNFSLVELSLPNFYRFFIILREKWDKEEEVVILKKPCPFPIIKVFKYTIEDYKTHAFQIIIFVMHWLFGKQIRIFNLFFININLLPICVHIYPNQKMNVLLLWPRQWEMYLKKSWTTMNRWNL